jgi:hypothetical protein
LDTEILFSANKYAYGIFIDKEQFVEFVLSYLKSGKISVFFLCCVFKNRCYKIKAKKSDVVDGQNIQFSGSHPAWRHNWTSDGRKFRQNFKTNTPEFRQQTKPKLMNEAMPI